MKKTVAILLSLVLLLGMAGCSSNSSAPAATGSEKTYKIKAAHMAADTHPWHPAILEFKKLVEERTNGKVQVEVYFGGTLGYDRDLIEGLQAGTVDVAYVTTAPVGSFVPEIGVLDLPYAFSNWDHLYKFLDSAPAKELNAMMEKKGLIAMGYMPNGFRHATNSKRPINSLEDFKGMKMRVMQSDVFIDTFQALGASPVPMAWAEVPTSLQQGTIDGQENGIITNYSNRVWEYQKYMSLTGHCAYMTTMLGSKVLLSKLPEEYQKIIIEAGKEASLNGMKKIQKDEQTILKEIAAKGLAVNEVDTTEFAKATEPVRKKFTDKYGDKILNDIMSLAK